MRPLAQVAAELWTIEISLLIRSIIVGPNFLLMKFSQRLELQTRFFGHIRSLTHIFRKNGWKVFLKILTLCTKRFAHRVSGHVWGKIKGTRNIFFEALQGAFCCKLSREQALKKDFSQSTFSGSYAPLKTAQERKSRIFPTFKRSLLREWNVSELVLVAQ